MKSTGSGRRPLGGLAALVGLGGLGALVGLGGLAALVGLGGVRVRRALRQSEQEEFVMDGITLLKNDHKTVEKLFKAFEKAGERAKQAKAKTVQQIIEELSVHAAIEEQIFYPAIRSEVQGTEDEVLESLEEHHIVKWVLSELDGMSPEDERFDAKVTVLIENVRHHVEEEETELFPQVRKALGRKRLGEIGDAMETAKKTAPKRPHPRGGDTPPANIISGLVAGAVDRVRDAASVS